jgi:membrane protein
MDKKQLYRIFRSSLKNWLEDNAPIRAAALTFFIILPLPTLLLIVVDLFALFLGPAQAINILVQQISAVAGPEVAGLFNELITSTGSPFTSVWTAVVVVGFSIGGAIGAFAVLRDTMDCIWEVHLPRAQPLWKRIRQRIGPFAIVSSLGLIVIVWTSIATGLFSLIRIYSINNTLAEIGVTSRRCCFLFWWLCCFWRLSTKKFPKPRYIGEMWR